MADLNWLILLNSVTMKALLTISTPWLTLKQTVKMAYSVVPRRLISAPLQMLASFVNSPLKPSGMP